jgi:hypothetical protein
MLPKTSRTYFEQKRYFFAKFFVENIFLIITSVPVMGKNLKIPAKSKVTDKPHGNDMRQFPRREVGFQIYAAV